MGARGWGEVAILWRVVGKCIPEVRNWAKQESGNRVLQGNGKVCGGILRPYACHSKELSMTWACRVQTGNRTYHRWFQRRLWWRHYFRKWGPAIKGLNRNVEAPRENCQQEAAIICGTEGTKHGVWCTGALWEIAQEGGLLGRSCEKGGVQ